VTATIAQVMDALANQIALTLAAVTDVTIHVEPRTFSIAELPSIDMALTAGTGLEGRTTPMGQVYGAIPITIRVRVSPADIYAGEDLLLALMDDVDPLSITAALWANPTLGGVVDDVGWGDGWPWTGYEPFADPNGQGDFLGSRLPIIVMKKHDEVPIPPDPVPIANAEYIYQGERMSGNPGVGGFAAHTWSGSDTWAANVIDADGVTHSIPASGMTFITTLPNGDQGTLTIDDTPTDHGKWFEFTGTHVTSGDAPSIGQLVAFTRVP